MGKTLFITRMAEKLQSVVPEGHKVIITIPVHGPVVTVDSVMQSLVNHQNSADCVILHFDISPSVLERPIFWPYMSIATNLFRCCGRWTLFYSLC